MPWHAMARGLIWPSRGWAQRVPHRTARAYTRRPVPRRPSHLRVGTMAARRAQSRGGDDDTRPHFALPGAGLYRPWQRRPPCSHASRPQGQVRARRGGAGESSLRPALVGPHERRTNATPSQPRHPHQARHLSACGWFCGARPALFIEHHRHSAGKLADHWAGGGASTARQRGRMWALFFSFPSMAAAISVDAVFVAAFSAESVCFPRPDLSQQPDREPEGVFWPASHRDERSRQPLGDL